MNIYLRLIVVCLLLFQTSTLLGSESGVEKQMISQAVTDDQDTINLANTGLWVDSDTLCSGDTTIVRAQFVNLSDVDVDSAQILVESFTQAPLVEGSMTYEASSGETPLHIEYDFYKVRVMIFANLKARDTVNVAIKVVSNEHQNVLTGVVASAICKPQGVYEPDFIGEEEDIYPTYIAYQSYLYSGNQNYKTLGFPMYPSVKPEYAVSYSGAGCQEGDAVLNFTGISHNTNFTIKNVNTDEVIAVRNGVLNSLSINAGKLSEKTTFEIFSEVNNVCAKETKTEYLEITPAVLPKEINLSVDDTVLCVDEEALITISDLESETQYNVSVNGNAGQIELEEDNGNSRVYKLTQLTSNTTVSVSAVSKDGCQSTWTLQQTIELKKLDTDIQVANMADHYCNDEEATISVSNMNSAYTYLFTNVENSTSTEVDNTQQMVIATSNADLDIHVRITDPLSGCIETLESIVVAEHVAVETPTLTVEPVEGCVQVDLQLELDGSFPTENAYDLINLGNQAVVAQILPEAANRTISLQGLTQSANYQLQAKDPEGRCPVNASETIVVTVNAAPENNMEVVSPGDHYCNDEDVMVSITNLNPAYKYTFVNEEGGLPVVAENAVQVDFALSDNDMDLNVEIENPATGCTLALSSIATIEHVTVETPTLSVEPVEGCVQVDLQLELDNSFPTENAYHLVNLGNQAVVAQILPEASNRTISLMGLSQSANYQLQAKDPQGRCPVNASGTIAVTVNAAPQSNIQVATLPGHYCNDEEVTVSVSNMNPAYKYTFINLDGGATLREVENAQQADIVISDIDLYLGAEIEDVATGCTQSIGNTIAYTDHVSVETPTLSVDPVEGCVRVDLQFELDDSYPTGNAYHLVNLGNQAVVAQILPQSTNRRIWLRGLSQSANYRLEAKDPQGRCPVNASETISVTVNTAPESNIQVASLPGHYCNDEEVTVSVSNMNAGYKYTFINLDGRVTLREVENVEQADIVISNADLYLGAEIEDLATGCTQSIGNTIAYTDHVSVETPLLSQEPIEGCEGANVEISLDNSFPTQNGYYLVDLGTQNVVGQILPQASNRTISLQGLTESAEYELEARDSQGRCTVKASETISVTVHDAPESDIEVASLEDHYCNDDEVTVSISNMNADYKYTFVNAEGGATLREVENAQQADIVISDTDLNMGVEIEDATTGCSQTLNSVANIDHISVETPLLSKEPVSGCEQLDWELELDNSFPSEYGYYLVDLGTETVVGEILPEAQTRSILLQGLTESTDFQLEAKDAQGRCPVKASEVMVVSVQSAPEANVDVRDVPENVCLGEDVSFEFFAKHGLVYDLWDKTTSNKVFNVTGNNDWVRVEAGEIDQETVFGFEITEGSCSAEFGDITVNMYNTNLDISTEMATLYEGCDETTITVTRQEGLPAYEMSISTLGLAKLDEDFTLSTSSISFEEGQEVGQIVLSALTDEEIEEAENVLLSFSTDFCNMPKKYEELVLENVDPIAIDMHGDIKIPSGLDLLLSPRSITGGTGEYTYFWNGEEGLRSHAIYVDADQEVTLKVVDDCGNEASHTFEIQVVPTGQESLVSQFRLYPNPATSALFVESSSNELPELMELINMSGQTVLKTQGNSLMVEGLPTGIYTVRLTLKGKVEHAKILIE